MSDGDLRTFVLRECANIAAFNSLPAVGDGTPEGATDAIMARVERYKQAVAVAREALEPFAKAAKDAVTEAAEFGEEIGSDTWVDVPLTALQNADTALSHLASLDLKENEG